MLSEPRKTFTEDFFRFDFETEMVSVTMERIAEKRGAGAGIVCELTIESSEPTAPGGLYLGTFNLLTANTALANKLKARREDVDWDGLLTAIAGIAVKRYRQGEPVVDLAEVVPTLRSRWLIPGFVEDTTRPTLIAAGGGVGKSTIGLAAAVTVASGVPVLGLTPARQCAVLYMDWEADADVHSERLRALWRGMGLDGAVPPMLFHYQRQVASLHESVSTIRRRVAELGIGFAVLDSVGFARGDDPNSAEATIRLFVANRKLGIPVLAIDHMSKEMLANPQSRKTAIGSVYTENSVCRVWVMKGEQVEPGVLAISLSDEKRNNTAKQPSLAYHVRLEDDGTTDQRPVSIAYERADYHDLPSGTQPGGQKYTMAKVIEEYGGNATDEQIAESMGVTTGTVRTLLARHKDWFVRLDSGRIGRLTEAYR